MAKKTSVVDGEVGSGSVNNTEAIKEKQTENGQGDPGTPIDAASKNQCFERYGTPPNLSQSGHVEKRSRGRPRKGKNSLTSAFPSCPRVLRSRSPKAPERSQHLANDGSNSHKKKKKKHVENVPLDEFSKIKRRVKYLLSRMNYEQNLIDAYSGEGWKGQSLEKIRPEKELQRANSEILRCKLKIRDLFQRLDMSCAEGKIPESLFDSEGEIDSEDIFCAKCGSTEVLANNDIILCDGYCERGFHQFCLEPPLLIEDIPPGDEGWLCPGCDCKVDCIDLVNDAHETNLSISDSWEKVFPEASSSGNNLDNESELPSDDSEDDDYNPDCPELDEEEVKGDKSDDESLDLSESDDLGVLPNKDEQYLGLPSDDSEDDDYNPNGKDTDEQARLDGSSSDFTSDSDDFISKLDDKIVHGEVQGDDSLLSKADHIKPSGKRSNLRGARKPSLNDELSSLLDSAPEGEGDLTRPGRRHIERLDYKKLHDEEYGNVSSSSDSSDEEYMVTADVPKKKQQHRRRRSETGKDDPLLPPDRKLEETEDYSQDIETTPKTPEDVEDTSDTTTAAAVAGGGIRSSAYKRLGEATTQRLLEAFRENRYPNRLMKENLANELLITLSQVSKWFENCRRAGSGASHNDTEINHEPPLLPEPDKCSGIVDSAKSNGKVPKLGNQTDPILVTCAGPNSMLGQTDAILVTKKGNGLNSRTLTCEKRESKIDNQTNPTLASNGDGHNSETPKSKKRKDGDGHKSKTPKPKKRKEKIDNNQTDPTWMTEEESSGLKSKTLKSDDEKVKMDNQTDSTLVTEEGNFRSPISNKNGGTSLGVNSSKAKQVRRSGRIQSKKSAG